VAMSIRTPWKVSFRSSSVALAGVVGTYQHCDAKHLHRYLAEFDFRYNNRAKLGINDVARTVNAMKPR
jgi:ISXO2-like transposase domain